MTENISPLQYVKGIGPKRAVLYKKLGITDPDALLRHYPRDYIDCTHPLTPADAPYGENTAVIGKVYQTTPARTVSGGRKIAKALIEGGGVHMSIVFFNLPYAINRLKIGGTYVFYGKVGGNLAMKELVNPMVLDVEETAHLIPVYRLTKGLSSRQIAKNIAQVLENPDLIPKETLPLYIREKYHFPALFEALHTVHSPENAEALEASRKRLIFEELLVLQLALASVRQAKEGSCAVIKADMQPFYAGLPFTLTGAQQKALNECLTDMQSQQVMSRLLQGDVGSGKTMVAAGCAFAAAKAGFQSVLMAPTEILARQHLHTMEQVLAPLGVSVGLLTGSMPKKEKEAVLSRLASGEIHLLVGTHAVLQDAVSFDRLGLVITDEQHRFGVEQRKTLASKGLRPHVLVMSATPIPRSLALVIYGDLDVSVIDELPAGRQPVSTYCIDSSKRMRMYGFLNRLMDQGQQGYIVCPAVEENPEGETDLHLINVQDYAKKVTSTVFTGRKCAVLHGKMKPAEKEKIMASFAEGKTDLLIATTVVEVGLDVPNATFMAVENAERFGLSQLHQLRGRVGRGRLASHCILISDEKNELTRRRLQTLCRTNDGFVLAGEDLKLRGPGDFFGARQHGLPQMQIADLASDMRILDWAREEAQFLLEQRERWKNTPLARETERLTSRLSAGALS